MASSCASQGKFKLDIWKTFFPAGVVRHRDRLLREAVESPSSEVLNRWTGHLGHSLMIMVVVGQMLRFYNLRIVWVGKDLCDS